MKHRILSLLEGNEYEIENITADGRSITADARIVLKPVGRSREPILGDWQRRTFEPRSWRWLSDWQRVR